MHLIVLWVWADNLVIGNCYLNKLDQDKSLKADYKEKFELIEQI